MKDSFEKINNNQTISIQYKCLKYPITAPDMEKTNGLNGIAEIYDTYTNFDDLMDAINAVARCYSNFRPDMCS